MHNKALMLVVATVTALALAGYIGAAPKAESATTISKYQNDRANHHPVNPAD